MPATIDALHAPETTRSESGVEMRLFNVTFVGNVHEITEMIGDETVENVYVLNALLNAPSAPSLFMQRRMRLRRSQKPWTAAQHSLIQCSTGDASHEACSICRDPVMQTEIATLPCQHYYHSMCVYTWLERCHAREQPASCPLCRCSVDSRAKTY
jgi:hypothetical protein